MTAEIILTAYYNFNIRSIRGRANNMEKIEENLLDILAAEDAQSFRKCTK